MSWISRLQQPQTFTWAWQKVRHFLRASDVWADDVEITAFELDLSQHVESIRDQMLQGDYEMAPLLLAAQPKGTLSKPEQRQTFTVSLRDQLAWAALLIAIGPEVDLQMPAWSYGNRLFRSVYREGDSKPWQLGPYRHSRGHTYRPFTQSWNLFRRHVYLTVRRMGLKKWDAEISPEDRQALDFDSGAGSQRLVYLRDGFWASRSRDVYYGSIDCEKFYPSLDLAKLNEALMGAVADPSETLASLVRGMLIFPIDVGPWTKKHHPELLRRIEGGYLHGLPTGMIASGFLANVAMLEVDREVDRSVVEAQVAHFRYVDDHVVLARSFEELQEWIEWYESFIASKETGAKLNRGKTKPEELALCLTGKSNACDNAVAACKLDPEFPSPLMTTTLSRISALAQAEFALMDRSAQDAMLRDLENLLVAPLPDTEVRHDTRLAFAASMLSRLVPEVKVDLDPMTRVAEEVLSELHMLPSAMRKGDVLPLEAHQRRVAALRKYKEAVSQQRAHQSELGRRTLRLMCKALQDHPDKIRLWDRVIQFCAHYAGAHQESVVKLLQRVIRASAITAGYLRAQVRRWYARELVRAARVVADDSGDPDTRYFREEFLLGFAESGMAAFLLKAGEGSHHEYRSRSLLRAAVGSVITVVGAAKGSGARKIILSKYQKMDGIDWNSGSSISEVYEATPVAAVLWSEGVWSSVMDDAPGPVWRASAAWMTPELKHAWQWCEPFPLEAPKEVWEPCIAGMTVDQRRGLQGWICDARGRSPIVGDGVTEGEAESGTVTVAQWWGDLNSTPNWDVDPRCSEWTALEVVRQMAMRFADWKSLGSGAPDPHPSNFLVMKGSQAAKRSWDEWEAWISKTKPINPVPAPDDHIEDRRYAPDWAGSDDPNWWKVRKLGMVLLALLMRDRRWPSTWNSSLQQDLHSTVLKVVIREVPASSWTTAILEASLLPRSRETTLLELFAPPGMDKELLAADTLRDPPRIDSVSTLIEAIEASQRVLKSRRLLIREHEPRQLVPVSLGQLSKLKWSQIGSEVED